MIEDVYEPLGRYRDEFRSKFHDLAVERFKELTAASGIDFNANRRLVARVRREEYEASSARTRGNALLALAILGFAAALGALAWGWFGPPGHRVWCVAAGLAGLVAGILPLGPRRRATRRARALEDSASQGRAEAWRQMAPLNALYTWDLTTRLIEATVPKLRFDPYFAAQRLADLRRLYGWDDPDDAGRSVLFAQSGVINGNPFVFADCLEQAWGEKTYTGSLEISWMEEEEDAEGRTRMVRRRETLTASVSRPLPVYATRKVLVYGNDAAPDLSFTRTPCDLSGAEEGFFRSLRMKWRRNRLKAFARNLEDESQYTLMGNHEFEVLFRTTDRTDEVEYRLLFTPVAQTQMLKLLKDRQVGYGDDFTFRKDGRINRISAAHLDRLPIDTDPARFRDWDWEAAYRRFVEFNDTYFKNVYFALAPLLAIPLYQQTRTHEDIWREVLSPRARASSWELEAIANYHGEEAFSHPDSVTRSILKTQPLARQDGVSRIAVTAHGFRGEARVSYVPVYGGDGYWHDVPVEWTEYLPVAHRREITVEEGARPAHPPGAAEALRRSIYSALR